MPAPAATSALPSAPRRGRVRVPSWLISLLAWFWKIILGVWGLVGLALIGDFLKALVTTGVSGATDPRTWTLTGQALAHPWLAGGIIVFAGLLTFAAFRADVTKRRTAEEAARRKREAEAQAERDRQAAEKAAEQEAHRQQKEEAARAERERAHLPYVIKRVETLDPGVGRPYIAQYVREVYLPRQADNEARTALRLAASGDAHAPLGICVFGRPTLGKTRLAREKLRAELPDWTLVLWPHRSQHTLDYAALRGERVALWLDDLHEFTSEQEARLLLELPETLKDAGARLVVVATCRDGEEEVSAGKSLSKLLERLTPIRPAVISRRDADQLAATLEREGVETFSDEFDQTPGSVVLGVRKMREERYPLLPESARYALWAMKLLRSARIYAYPEARVRETAEDLFSKKTADEWQAARAALLAASFVRVEAGDGSSERALAPVADVYLERAVPDFPAQGEDPATYWPDLARSLMRRKDAAALIGIGIAFNQRPLGNLRANQEQAVACYRAALEVCTRAVTPTDWASTQNNLGNALRDLAGLAEGQEQADLLAQAVACYRAALEVRTRQQMPFGWASTQFNLALTYLDLGEALAARDKQAACTALREGQQCVTLALQVFTHAHLPAYHRQAREVGKLVEAAMQELGCEA